jgi:hypothetical protein
MMKGEIPATASKEMNHGAAGFTLADKGEVHSGGVIFSAIKKTGPCHGKLAHLCREALMFGKWLVVKRLILTSLSVNKTDHLKRPLCQIARIQSKEGWCGERPFKITVTDVGTPQQRSVGLLRAALKCRSSCQR